MGASLRHDPPQRHMKGFTTWADSILYDILFDYILDDKAHAWAQPYLQRESWRVGYFAEHEASWWFIAFQDHEAFRLPASVVTLADAEAYMMGCSTMDYRSTKDGRIL